MKRRWKALIAASVIALGAAGPALAQRAAGVRPDIATDEGGLWAASDKAEQKAKASAEINKNEALNAYVRDAVCKVAAEHCADIRVYVLDRPYFNASMAPNGYMEVWSGLLLRAESEAQLSFVLGHETGHFVQNHSINAWRAAKSRSTAAMFLSLGAAVVGAGFVGDIIYLGTIASLFGFSRENEEEADRIGFEHAVAAGYDPNAGAALWRYLIAETEHSDFEKTRKEMAKGGVFNSHPLSADRVEALDELAQGKPAGAIGEKAHRAAIRPFLGPWLKDDLRRKDFGESLYLIDHLAQSGEDLGVLNYYKGEAYRLRRKEGDQALARAAYEEAAKHEDAPPETWRELSDIYAREEFTDAARRALETYYAKAPDAEDRLLVEMRLKQWGWTPPPPPVELATDAPSEEAKLRPASSDTPPAESPEGEAP